MTNIKCYTVQHL